MMEIRISANGVTLRHIEVVNTGHPLTGKHEPADLRRYRWFSPDDGQRGHVDHHRSRGAERLAERVLACYRHQVEGS